VIQSARKCGIEVSYTQLPMFIFQAMMSNVSGISKPMLFVLGWRSYSWKKLRAMVALFLLSTITAAAQTYHVAPGPTGSDANDCSSPSKACATFQRAVDLCPPARYCDILAAPGIYSQKTNVIYYKIIAISGPLDKDRNCIDRGGVVIDDRMNGTDTPGAIFLGQDHTILAISCMTLAAYAGSAGFSTRQFAIGDVNDVNFGKFQGALGVSATEASKINIRSPGIYGSASRFAVASYLSQVTIGGTIKMGEGLTFEVAFLSALSNSTVLVYPSKIVGGQAMSGASYQCNDATIKTNVTLPGGDVPYVGTENCTFNAIHLNPEITAIRSEIDEKLGPEIKAIRSDIDEKLGPEIKAIRSDIDEKLSPEIKAIYTNPQIE
jgi:hypothetical protein